MFCRMRRLKGKPVRIRYGPATVIGRKRHYVTERINFWEGVFFEDLKPGDLLVFM